MIQGSYLKYEPLVAETFCSVLREVELNTGLTVSYDKTSLYRVGSLRNSNAKQYTESALNWTNKDISTLGITLTCDGEVADCNYTDLIEKLDRVIHMWYNCSLSLTGKILIINTLMASLFVYKLSVLLEISGEQIKQINKKIHGYLWKGKRARIAMNTLTKPRHHGGMNLVDIGARQKALQISWIGRLENDEFLARCAYSQLDPHIGSIIWRCNLSPKDIQTCFKSSYWRSVLTAWSDFQAHQPTTKQQVWDEILWYNSYIRVGNKPVFGKVLFDIGILFISDIFNEDGTSKDLPEFVPEAQAQWLLISSLQSSIPKAWKSLLKSDIWEVCGENKLATIALQKKCSSIAYKHLVADQLIVTKYYESWQRENVSISYEEYLKSFENIRAITKIAKYCDFQYKLLLYKIVTNLQLYEWKMLDNPRCTFCDEEESYKHLFFDCRYVQPVINFVYNLTSGEDKDYSNWMFNKIKPKKDHIINMYAMISKQYVYRCRCLKRKPSIVALTDEILLINKIELIEARRNRKYDHFNKRWSPVGLNINLDVEE